MNGTKVAPTDVPRTCGLHHTYLEKDNYTCPDGQRIVGTWSRHPSWGGLSDAGEGPLSLTRLGTNFTPPVEEGWYYLRDCPNGYSLINSTDGLSRGTFSHNLQRCHKCDVENEYILHPNHDECQRCPPGLYCHGDETYEVVVNSTWAWHGDMLLLEKCTYGYEVYFGTVPDGAEQECRECPRGEECVTDWCVDCTLCPAGRHKPSHGIEACAVCPEDTWSHEGAINCTKCPVGSWTLRESTDVMNCTCTAGYTGPDGARCEACPAGTYKPDTGDAPCTLCQVGFWSRAVGAFQLHVRGLPHRHVQRHRGRARQ
jgi:hypothetical protein